MKEFTNPQRRCKECNGREVTTIQNKWNAEVNLIREEDGSYRCENEQECIQNIEAEQTEVEFGINEETGKIKRTIFSYNGKSYFEIEEEEE